MLRHPTVDQSAPPSGSYLEGTLAQIVTLANEDVEMKVRTLPAFDK